jgi:hypothetical protein
MTKCNMFWVDTQILDWLKETLQLIFVMNKKVCKTLKGVPYRSGAN